MTRLSLVPCDPGDDPDEVLPDANESAVWQASAASAALGRSAKDFLHLPLEGLAIMTGDIPESDVWYVGGFSGDGKTAFFSSLTLALMGAGKHVYYVPTETSAPVLRNHLAAKALGYDVGDMLTGVWRSWPDYADVKRRIRATLKAHADPDDAGRRRLWVADQGLISATRLEVEAAHAAQLGADVFIVDHIDHIEGSGRSMWEASVAANKMLLHIAHTYKLRVFAATQFNLEAVKGNRVMRYMAPRETYVYMGNYKRQIASGMLGLYRPLKFTDLDKDALKAFNKGSSSVTTADILEPNTMAVSLMKHRLYGAREGQKAFLRVERGRVLDMDSKDLGYLHGIRTNEDL